MFMQSHKEDALKHLMTLRYTGSIDTAAEIDSLRSSCDKAVLHILYKDDEAAAFRTLKYAADWFEYPHPPEGRDPQGEVDFIAIRLVCALFEPACYSVLPQEVKASLRRFFVRRNYRSMHTSENHCLMFRVSRLLAAQFYREEYFENYGMTAQECLQTDTAYINEFLDFRAGRGWGEFDSLGYAYEVMLILVTLHRYVEDPALKNKCRMAMDIILLDMIADSQDALYGGAHGRSYPEAVLDRLTCGMSRLYRYYFGGRFYNGKEIDFANFWLSDYIPSAIVYEVLDSRTFPYENREKKHLHSCLAWKDEIRWDILAELTGSINKYTYVCEDYILGSVHRQEDYPDGSADGWYARHQQHEWELTLPGGGTHKIFTHHSALADYHKINNRWTGDCGCCCGSFYTNRNTALAMYNIEDRTRLPLVNAYVPLEVFDEVLQQEKYLFLSYGKLYISLYFDNGYRINREDEFENRELLSDGWQNAVVLRVEPKVKFASLAAFAQSIRALPVVFDREKKTLAFDGVLLRRNGSSENGAENVYPYPKTYDCPFMQSAWESGVIEVTAAAGTPAEKRVVYDFTANCIRE